MVVIEAPAVPIRADPVVLKSPEKPPGPQRTVLWTFERSDLRLKGPKYQPRRASSPFNRDQKALKRGTLGGLYRECRPPNVAPLRAPWSLLDGIWGVLKGSWGNVGLLSENYGLL